MIAVSLNEAGQAHVAAFLKSQNVESWSVEGVCSEIEGTNSFMSLEHMIDDGCDVEIIRRGKIGNDAPIMIEILADEHVYFECADA